MSKVSDGDRLAISIFCTQLGWMGLLGRDNQLLASFAGYQSPQSIRKASKRNGSVVEQSDWDPELRQMFEAYAEGEIIDFSRVKIVLPPLTDFRLKIVMATRRIGYGQTVTYGDLARRAGHPGAARAVGTVMSTNRFPILIPCHRVLASGGKIGGYTAPAGIGLKQRMLQMEARQTGKKHNLKKGGQAHVFEDEK
jgi:methylated-DNA-[protein]-cysteine S-methyltransferase